ncbi:bifunctional transcriptional activator/DNA repair enzyme AdaA [Serratia sp. M24T3]|uniref:bifunctional transcriptional activator/DNA repair enzyme AdaA n=1 Tax=Serratia sp. M24T3 TaxID=932213 RepID=UPI00025B93A5|nr:trifunctional transcriptional activator/DNA repair protein Ada/methylated-DNA--[protein]-cysteine S-methyltransferase [Serratia sp. M24T3]EIC84386.1 methylated-DNA--protein-cysteine methyltransferase [Serratia sp. M24T3]
MLFDLPDDDILYRALIERDPSFDGFAFVGVKSTGIFCRLTCPARKPKRENSVFYSSVASAMEAGYRPCKRCCPLMLGGQKDPLIDNLLTALENSPDKRWSEDDVQAMKMDPSTVRRAFKRQFGITFLEIARLRRLGKGVDALTKGNQVIEAQLDANYESSSGFRAAITRQIGLKPSHAHRHLFLKAEWLDTPIGTMLAIADEQTLYLLEFVDRPALANAIDKLKKLTSSEIIFGRTAALELLNEELISYFSGKNQVFKTHLAEFGSLFTRKVWDALRAIPTGELRSYSDLAKDIGQPSASRAVARANGANQISILIPCHRVIGADGSLTGYGGGLWRKRWLIEHERRIAMKSSKKEWGNESGK